MKFDEGIDELAHRVGEGELTATVSFSPDRIAVPQERGTWFTGPNAGVRIRHYTKPGTGPGYLADSLLEVSEGAFARVAAEVVEIGPQHAMIEAADSVLQKAQERVPYKDGDLHDSGRAEVSDDGRPIHISGSVGVHV